MPKSSQSGVRSAGRGVGQADGDDKARLRRKHRRAGAQTPRPRPAPKPAPQRVWPSQRRASRRAVESPGQARARLPTTRRAPTHEPQRAAWLRRLLRERAPRPRCAARCTALLALRRGIGRRGPAPGRRGAPRPAAAAACRAPPGPVGEPVGILARPAAPRPQSAASRAELADARAPARTLSADESAWPRFRRRPYLHLRAFPGGPAEVAGEGARAGASRAAARMAFTSPEASDTRRPASPRERAGGRPRQTGGTVWHACIGQSPQARRRAVGRAASSAPPPSPTTTRGGAEWSCQRSSAAPPRRDRLRFRRPPRGRRARPKSRARVAGQIYPARTRVSRGSLGSAASGGLSPVPKRHFYIGVCGPPASGQRWDRRARAEARPHPSITVLAGIPTMTPVRVHRASGLRLPREGRRRAVSRRGGSSPH